MWTIAIGVLNASPRRIFREEDLIVIATVDSRVLHNVLIDKILESIVAGLKRLQEEGTPAGRPSFGFVCGV